MGGLGTDFEKIIERLYANTARVPERDALVSSAFYPLR